MNNTNTEVKSGINSQESEFVWTNGQTMMQKSVRKADKNWTDRVSEDQKCFSSVLVRCGDDVCAMNTNYWDTQRSHRTARDKDGNVNWGRGGEREEGEGIWAGQQLSCGPGTGVIIGENLFEGHSWTIGVVSLVTVGMVLLSCASVVLDPHLPTGNVYVTREPQVARKPSGMTFEKHANKDHRPRKVRAGSLSWYSGDQLWQLMEILNTR